MTRATNPGGIAFMYLGRRGALGPFTLELSNAARRAGVNDAGFIVSSNSGLGEKLKKQGARVHEIPTFDTPASSALVTGFFRARRKLKNVLHDLAPATVINLMPHVWTPLLSPLIQKKGARVVTVVHDATPHPGDPTARVTRWLLREAAKADRVVTLSNEVARALTEQKLAIADKITPLFHPDLTFDQTASPRTRTTNSRLRLLFLGRIMKYKGLEILIEAVEALKSQGTDIDLGVAGSGEIAPATREKLAALGAEVINRWIRDEEISQLLARYDALACAHIEASQSGVAATAFGHAMPVVAMPVGGVAEQVMTGNTGVLANGVSARDYADAIGRLANDVGLYNAMSRNLVKTAPERSMDRFLAELAALR